MCDLTKNSYLNKINNKNKIFNSFITGNKYFEIKINMCRSY